MERVHKQGCVTVTIEGPEEIIGKFSVDMDIFNHKGKGTETAEKMREIAEAIGGEWTEDMSVGGVQWMKAGDSECEWTVFA